LVNDRLFCDCHLISFILVKNNLDVFKTPRKHH
jgi:hypothetical protein